MKKNEDDVDPSTVLQQAQDDSSGQPVVSIRAAAAESVEEVSLRPKALDSFVGQAALKKGLGLMLAAAQMRTEPLDHVLFYGPPGLGKTTLGGIIAAEMKSTMREVAAPALQKSGDLASLLVSLRRSDVLFLDEIHRLRNELAEMLYSAMEDFKFTVQPKDDLAVTVPLQRFTLVGATTDYGQMPAPLRDRFGHSFAINLYSIEELELVIANAADKLELLCDVRAVRLIAERGRGTPRVVLRLLRRARDLAQVSSEDVTLEIAEELMGIFGIDSLGLDDADRRYLSVLIEQYGGGPVGPKSLSASSLLDFASIEQVIEPALLSMGLIRRTRRGREITERGLFHVRPEPLPEEI